MINFDVMKAVVSSIVVLFIFFAISSGCKKPHGNSITGGGIGGNGIISVSPAHHGSFIDTCRVYIKYGTLDAPADGNYDDSVLSPLPIVHDSVPVGTFYHLKTGLYYIYCIGIHPSFNPPNVKGGLPFTLSKGDSENIIIPTYEYNQ